MKLTFSMTDIHGRYDLLLKALYAINQTYPDCPDRKFVFCGDYVDRGPQSAEVVQHIMDMSESEEVVALRGNHEDMFVEYVLGSSQNRVARQMFESNGGLQTIASYDRWNGANPSLVMKRHALWMQSLPYWHRDEKRLFIHAGMWPGKRIEDQQPEVLAWMRSRDFFNATRLELGYHVVHGHTPAHDTKRLDAVELTPARTNLDLASFQTGKLAVAVFNDTQERPHHTLIVEAN